MAVLGLVTTAPGQVTHCVPAPAGIVAWWPGESNTWDVANGFDASFGSPPPPSALTYTNGRVGSAFRFLPGWQLIVPATPQLDLGKGDGFTFETWLNPDSAHGSFSVFGWGGYYPGQPRAPGGVYLAIHHPGILHAGLVKTNGQGYGLRSSAGTVVAGLWQHVALSCNRISGEMVLYVNGSTVASVNFGTDALQTTGPLALGASLATSGLRYAGLLDEPTVYNRALTQAEIQAIHAAAGLGKCPLPPRNCIPLASDIAGWWRGESNTLDSVTTNHGVMQPNIVTPLFYTNGLHGTAFALGYGNYVLVPASPSLNVGSGPGLTVEAWVHPTGSSVPIVEWNTGTGTQGVSLAYSATRGMPFIEASLVGELGRSHLLSSPVMTPLFNQWSHVAMTYDRASGAAALFVNGYEVAQTNLGSFTPRTTGNLYFGYRPPGRYPGSGSRFHGFMDEVTVYRRALDAAEIRCLLTQGETGKYPPLTECLTPAQNILAWWRGESNGLDSVSGNHAASSMPMAWTTYTSGRIGTAFLAGSGFWVARFPPMLNVADGPGITVEGWIKPDQLTPGSIFAWDQSGIHLDCGTHGSGSLRANLRDTTGVPHHLMSAAGLVQADQWQHVAVTYDKTSGWGSLYLNGNPIVSTNLGSFLPQASDTMRLGIGPAGIFRGGLDEFAVYQRALTSFEIAAIYRSPDGRCMDPPAIAAHPQSQRVNAGSDVLFSVEAVGNPLLRYAWGTGQYFPQRPSVLPGATNHTLLLTNVQAKDARAYWVRVTNAFGSTVSSNATLWVNHPPVADASATLPVVISSNNTNATLVLDGSRSSDPDGDPLVYTWLLNNQPPPLATGVVAVVTLPVGFHSLSLIVDDGLLRDTNAVTVQVLTTLQGVERLMATVRGSDIPRKQSLLAILSAAHASLVRGHPTPAANQLRAFQKQVMAQVLPANPDLGAELVRQAQAILDALREGGVPGPGRSHLVAKRGEGKVQLEFTGSVNRIYLIEASTNMVHWETIGVARDGGKGRFEFDDPHADKFPGRYYRVVTP